MDVNVITGGINSRIRAGYYECREKLLDDAGGATDTKNRDGGGIVQNREYIVDRGSGWAS